MAVTYPDSVPSGTPLTNVGLKNQVNDGVFMTKMKAHIIAIG